jgi:thymidylate synthase
MEKKQTAVDWLEQAYWDNKGTLSQKHFEQAKQMEKEQMKEAALDNVTTNEKLRKIFEIQFEDFYNETYGGEDETL